MYPTKEEILAKEHKFRPGVLAAIKGWKVEQYHGWRDRPEHEKMEALRQLVADIAVIYDRPVRLEHGDFDHYCRANETIYLFRPSIVTALHELGHHLKGSSELAACRFSVWLFKKAFPRSFERLHFEGHLLRQ